MTDPIMSVDVVASADVRFCPADGNGLADDGVCGLCGNALAAYFDAVPPFSHVQSDAATSHETPVSLKVGGEAVRAYIRSIGSALAPEHRSIAMAAFEAGWLDRAALAKDVS